MIHVQIAIVKMAETKTHKDSMRSTWRNDPSTWKTSHRAFVLLDTFPTHDDRPIPIHSKEEKVPYLSEWQAHQWVLFHSFTPLAIHQAYVYATGTNFGPIAAFIFYFIAFQIIMTLLARHLRRLGHIHGFLDGDQHTRDGVPDNKVTRVFLSLAATTILRPLITVSLTYRSTETPLSINLPWLVAEVGAYSVILDFYFYWYHRMMHEVDFLWKFHRTHHLTKHPIPLLAAFADEEQEFFDMIGCPLITYITMKLIGFPMGFYEWWICQIYVSFAEVIGHSGLRVYITPPSSVSWLMQLMGCELITEDHDLHHRYGYKTSGNYGKQTRLWDTVFGTCQNRIESKSGNVDFNRKIDLPIFF